MSLYYLFMKWIIQNTAHFNWAGWSPRDGSKPTDYVEFVEWNEMRAALHCLSYNDDRADHVGSSVVGSSGPTASYPPLPCEEVRAPVFRPEASCCKVFSSSSEIQGCLWCVQTCLEQLRVVLLLVAWRLCSRSKSALSFTSTWALFGSPLDSLNHRKVQNRRS